MAEAINKQVNESTPPSKQQQQQEKEEEQEKPTNENKLE
jgi:hypothetical protein